MSTWTLAKYALTLAGIAVVIGADRLGHPRFGYVGLGLLAVAFLLRFVERRRMAATHEGPASAGPSTTTQDSGG